MRISSFLLSLLLHIGLLVAVYVWPTSPPVDLNRPVYQVSLVMGDPGGENLPSAVLGARAPASDKPLASTSLAEKPTSRQDAAAPPLPADTPATAPLQEAPAAPRPESLPETRPEATPVSRPEPPKPVQAPEPPKTAIPSQPPKPEPKKEEPEPKPTPKPEPKKDEPKAEPKPEPKPETKPEPKKEEPKKDEPKKDAPKGDTKKSDPLADALADAKRQAGAGASPTTSNKPSTSKPGGGGSASRALADLEKQTSTGVGGGGGQGDGPGGGGIYDVYAGLVMLAVKPNWSMPTYSRDNLMAQVRIKLDASGRVLDCSIERSSGRADFDASAVNAVIRTGTLPEPPTPDQQDLIVTFNSLEMMGR